MYTAADALGEDYPTAYTDPLAATDESPCGLWPLANRDTQQCGEASILDGLTSVLQPGL
jgi:hypothetical protein